MSSSSSSSCYRFAIKQSEAAASELRRSRTPVAGRRSCVVGRTTTRDPVNPAGEATGSSSQRTRALECSRTNYLWTAAAAAAARVVERRDERPSTQTHRHRHTLDWRPTTTASSLSLSRRLSGGDDDHAVLQRSSLDPRGPSFPDVLVDTHHTPDDYRRCCRVMLARHK